MSDDKMAKSSGGWSGYNGTFWKFKREGLNRPGTLIKTKFGISLIGDINELGGCCDCCRDIEDLVQVEQFRVVELGNTDA